MLSMGIRPVLMWFRSDNGSDVSLRSDHAKNVP